MLDRLNRWLYEKLHIGQIKDTITEPYFSQNCSFGVRQGEKAEVEFIIPSKGTKYPIVDKNGKFVNFPGIEHADFVASYCGLNAIKPIISFRTDFERTGDGRYLVIWEIQPDGRYWEDESGFGRGSDVEVRLYAYLDENGNFQAPFRIYNIGNLKFWGTDLEEEWVQEYEETQEEERKRIASGQSVDDAIRELIDRTCEYAIKIFPTCQNRTTIFSFPVPSSRYEADIRMEGHDPEWRLIVDVKIAHTDLFFSNYFPESGCHDRTWIVESLKKPETRAFIFTAVKHLCERIDKE